MERSFVRLVPKSSVDVKYLPSLEEIDIVELVQFNGELEGCLQVGHGA